MPGRSLSSTRALQTGHALKSRKSAILPVSLRSPCASKNASVPDLKPGGNIRNDIITIQDPNHPSTAGLPTSHNRTDEWYSYRDNVGLSPDYTVLATLNETYIDDITPAYLSMKPTHPISWYHVFEGKARAWYTGQGHTVETYSEDYFIQHVTGGLEWVVGVRD